MNDRIKSIRLFRFDIQNGESLPSDDTVFGQPVSITELDEKGQVLNEWKYLPDGTVEERHVFQYDSQGNLIEETYYYGEEFSYKDSYKLDESGNRTSITRYYADGSLETTHYKYNDAGNLVEKTIRDEEEVMESTEHIKWNGTQVSHRVVMESGDLVLEEKFTYDDHGCLLEQTRWSNEDEKHHYIFSFDDAGRVTKSLRLNSLDKVAGKTTYQYRPDGQIAEIVEELQGNITVTIFEYDIAGNPIRQTEQNNKGEIHHEVLRKFDSRNRIELTEVTIHPTLRFPGQHYFLRYDYDFYAD